MSADARYSCQIKLPGFGVAAQTKLKRAKVLIVGAGGLGCPAAQYLVSAGVGRLDIADFDRVAKSNLNRQILFDDKDIGKFKVKAAAKKLSRQNSNVRITPLPMRVATDNVLGLVGAYGVVLDCTDNFETRQVLNDACVLAGKPLIYGAAYQYQGQVAVWNAPNRDGTRSPHFRDIFPSVDATLAENCSDGGVTPTLTGIIGCLQANEAIKYLAGLPGLLSARLLIFDALTMESHVISLPPVSSAAVESMPLAVPAISAPELRAALPRQLYELIDVRSAHEHAHFNIGGRLMPLEEIIVGIVKPDLDRPTVFYCTNGNRSAAVVRHIRDKYPKAPVLSLDGGIKAWKALPNPALRVR